MSPHADPHPTDVVVPPTDCPSARLSLCPSVCPLSHTHTPVVQGRPWPFPAAWSALSPVVTGG